MQDQALIEGVLRGDRGAFEVLVTRYQHTIYGYLRARLLQHSDAEDLTQEVFLRFYLARARFDHTQMIRPWLLGIARNLLREHARSRRKFQQCSWTTLCLELEDLLRVDAPEPQPEALDNLSDCLDDLGQSARQAIELHYQQNLRLSEIGEKLRRSEGAVKLLVFRARQALKRCLDFKTRQSG
jgi:RNA polymerase sigma-70 factor, ECF subfamily